MRAGRSAAILLLPLLLTLAKGSGATGALITDAVVVAVAGGFGAVSWAVTRWRVEAGVLLIEGGLLRRRSQRLPIAQLQAVDVVQPGLARLFDMAEIRLRMAGSEGRAGRLSFLGRPEAEQLRTWLLDARRAPTAGAGRSERTLVEVRTGRLAASILLGSGAGLALALGVVIAAVAAFHSSALPVVFSSLGTVILGNVTFLWRRFNSGYRLRVTEGADGLRIRSGLLQTTAETIPVGRVQGVRMTEPVLWQLFGWCRLDVDVAGRQRSGGENKSEGRGLRAFLPVGTRADAVELLRRVLPGAEAVAGAKPPRRAVWKSPLRYRRLSWGTDGRYAMTTSGRLRRATDWVPLGKVQSVRLVEGPVQRQLGLASVHLDVAGRNVRAALRDRDRDECDRVMVSLPDACRAARHAS